MATRRKTTGQAAGAATGRNGRSAAATAAAARSAAADDVLMAAARDLAAFIDSASAGLGKDIQRLGAVEVMADAAVRRFNNPVAHGKLDSADVLPILRIAADVRESLEGLAGLIGRTKQRLDVLRDGARVARLTAALRETQPAAVATIAAIAPAAT